MADDVEAVVGDEPRFEAESDDEPRFDAEIADEVGE